MEDPDELPPDVMARTLGPAEVTQLEIAETRRARRNPTTWPRLLWRGLSTKPLGIAIVEGVVFAVITGTLFWSLAEQREDRRFDHQTRLSNLQFVRQTIGSGQPKEFAGLDLGLLQTLCMWGGRF